MIAKRAVLAGFIVPCMLTGCIWVREPRGDEGMVMVPLLPPVVVLGPEPYYEQSGYHYYYRDGGWSYSHSRGGPWTTLPRDHYPREVRYRDGGAGHDKGRDSGHDKGRDSGHR